MKKYTKLALMIIIILLLLPVFSFASSSKIKSIDINNINLNSIDENKIEDLKEVLNDINVNELNSATVVNSIDKNTVDRDSIVSGNVDINSVDVNAIDIDEIIGIYEELSKVISNEDIANLIKDNSEFLVDSGINPIAISTSETLLRRFDSTTVIDIAKNDLDINKLLELYKNGASLEDILSSILTSTSTETKLKIAFKLLFSSIYFRITFVILIIVAIYSIYITGLIFNKAGKKKFITLIPIYRDIVHLKICNLSPWLLLLLFIPFVGWFILFAIAIIGRFELAKSFGHGFFFGLGLLFLPIVFRSIIAFSSNEYIEDNLDEE